MKEKDAIDLMIEHLEKRNAETAERIKALEELLQNPPKIDLTPTH